jgi:hypothetical protein
MIMSPATTTIMITTTTLITAMTSAYEARVGE